MINIDFTKGLVPAVAQDISSGEVLMVAYMNEEAYQKTLESGTAWFYSRSRNELWNKGATSGNYLIVKEVLLDCDGDTVLLKVEPKGPACHTGNKSCFFTTTYGKNTQSPGALDALYKVILSRKESQVENSYTNYLFSKGRDKILKKLGEEAAEVIIEGANSRKEGLVSESCDLLYHLMILWADMDLPIKDIYAELEKRRQKIGNFKGERKDIEVI